MRYRINSAYDCDYAYANTSMPGYNEWAKYYQRYQVLYTKIVTTIENTGETPLICGIVFRPVYTEGTWSNWVAWRNLIGSGIPGREYEVAAAGNSGCRRTISFGMRLANLIGNPRQYHGESGYSATIDSNPAIEMEGFVYCLTAQGNTVTTAKCVLKTSIYMTIRLYEKKYLVATLFDAPTTTDDDQPNAPSLIS